MLKRILNRTADSTTNTGRSYSGSSRRSGDGISGLGNKIRQGLHGLFEPLRNLRAYLVNDQIVMRVIADIILVNVSLVVALVSRFLVFSFLGLRKLGLEVDLFEILDSSIYLIVHTGILLTPLSIVVFALSGFYTRGRKYRGRYKAFVIIRAIFITYLIFAAIVYFFYTEIRFPLWPLLMAFVHTCFFVGGARYLALMLTRSGIARQIRKPDPRWRRIQNVLVIGGAGYIGSLLCRKLLDQGFNVRVLDKLVYGDDPISKLYDTPNFELIRGDFRNLDSVVDSMLEIDAVVHLGAIVGDPASALDPRSTTEINLLATQMIAEVAKGYGVQRMIFASTCSVYGASNGILNEKSQLNPVSLYARTKIESENLLLGLSSQGFAPTILRFATIHGLSFRPRFDLVVNLLSARAAVEKKIGIFGGSQWRPFIHVGDAADAIVRVIQAPLNSVRSEIFNVGSTNENYQIKEIGTIIRQILPDVKIEYADLDGDKRNYIVSFQKIEKKLDFNANRIVREGVTEIINAVKEGLIPDYSDPHFSNVAYLKKGVNLSTLKESTSIARLSEFINY